MPQCSSRPRTPQDAASRGRPMGAFTLIEVLVVVAVIAILSAIVVIVGSNVLQGQQGNNTRDAIRQLDIALQEFELSGGVADQFPSVVADPRDEASNTLQQSQFPTLWPIADAEATGSTSGRLGQINSGGLAMLLIADVVPEVTDSIPTEIAGVAVVSGEGTDAFVDDSATLGLGLETPLDAWGQPIRFVHPNFDGFTLTGEGAFGPDDNPYQAFENFGPDGVQDDTGGDSTRSRLSEDITAFERNNNNSDAGEAPNNRPYFYSIGPDGDPGAGPAEPSDLDPEPNDETDSGLDDNVYTNNPVFSEAALNPPSNPSDDTEG